MTIYEIGLVLLGGYLVLAIVAECVAAVITQDRWGR